MSTASQPTAAAPEVVVFDVNETLSDLAPMRERFAEVGAAESLAPTWFSSVLRDGMALCALGQTAGFADVAGAVLDTLLPDSLAGAQRTDAIAHVMEGFLSLGVHPDVPDGLRDLREQGLRLVTLSNGASSVAQGLLRGAGVSDLVEATLSVADAGIWKPVPAAYAHAVAYTGVPVERHLLVAVHPWDVHGAQHAGMSGAWIDRTGEAPFPPHFSDPTLRATSLVDLAELLASSGGEELAVPTEHHDEPR